MKLHQTKNWCAFLDSIEEIKSNVHNGIECLQTIHSNKVHNLEYITKKEPITTNVNPIKTKDLNEYFFKEHVVKTKRHTNRYFNISGH